MADDYINEMVDRSKGLLKKPANTRFILFGHSARGQFASRYAVKNPERVRAVVITAADQYAMPDPTVEWPNGMKAIQKTIHWGPNRVPNRSPLAPSRSAGSTRPGTPRQ